MGRTAVMKYDIIAALKILSIYTVAITVGFISYRTGVLFRSNIINTNLSQMTVSRTIDSKTAIANEPIVMVVTDFSYKTKLTKQYMNGLKTYFNKVDLSPRIVTRYIEDYNSTDQEKNERIVDIAKQIVDINPKYLCLVGPLAYQSLSKISKLYKGNIVVSGITRYIKEQICKFDYCNNITYIYETFNTKKILNTLDKQYKYINDVYIITNVNMYPIYKYVTQKYITSFVKNYKTYIFNIETLSQLNRVISRIPNNKKHLVVFLCFGIRDNSKMLSPYEAIEKVNIKKYRFTKMSYNQFFCNKCGFDICCGPDLYLSGSETARLISEMEYGIKHSSLYLPTNIISNKSLYPEKDIKVAIISSYDVDDPCGRPQIIGLIKRLKQRLPNVNFYIKIYYMRTKKVNVTESQKYQQSEYAREFIKRMKPNVVITVDDDAFNYVGTYVSKDYKVVFTGLNKPFSYYQEKVVNVNNVAGVEEMIDTSPIFELLKKANIPIRNITVLASSSPTTTEEAVHKHLINVGEKYNIPINFLYNNNVSQFKANIKELNQYEGNIILISSISSLYDFKQRRYVSMFELNKILSKLNTRHIDMFVNSLFCRFTPLSLCAGPCFYEMGRKAADIIIDTINMNKFEHIIVRPTSILTCNYGKLQKIGYSFLYDNFPSMYEKVF